MKTIDLISSGEAPFTFLVQDPGMFVIASMSSNFLIQMSDLFADLNVKFHRVGPT